MAYDFERNYEIGLASEDLFEQSISPFIDIDYVWYNNRKKTIKGKIPPPEILNQLRKYDLVIFLKNGTYITVEIKRDRTAEKSGKVAVLYYKSYDGKKTKIPAGVYISESNMYAIHINDVFYCIDTPVLREFVKDNQTVYGTYFDPASNSAILLIPIDEIKKLAKELPVIYEIKED
jgi:hypothetical protein